MQLTFSDSYQKRVQMNRYHGNLIDQIQKQILKLHIGNRGKML